MAGIAIGYTQSIYYINNSLLVNGILPPTKRQPILTNLISTWNIGMSYLNQNLCEYIFGTSYSYYSSTASYIAGQRVNGGLSYQNGVYQFLSGAGDAIITSTISTPGYGYSIGEIVSVAGGNPLATMQIGSVSNPSGFTINITGIVAGQITVAVTNNQGTGYAVNDIVTINGGFSLATFEIASVSGTGAVLSWITTYSGTGYSLGTNIGSTIQPIYTGNVLSVSLLGGGDNYTAGISYSTNIISGVGGTGLKITPLTIGGFPVPGNTASWELTNNNFIGVNERAYFTDSKMGMEWALNRWYNSNFRQPISATNSFATHSDIYIQDNITANTPFILAPNSSNLSSTMFPKGSSAYMSSSPVWSTSFFSTNFYTIYVPNTLLTTIPNGTASIMLQANKYNYFSIPFNIAGY